MGSGRWAGRQKLGCRKKDVEGVREGETDKEMKEWEAYAKAMQQCSNAACRQGKARQDRTGQDRTGKAGQGRVEDQVQQARPGRDCDTRQGCTP